MVKFLLHTLVKFQQIAGVDLTLGHNGIEACLCILEKKKGVVRIIKQQTNINSIDDLLGILPSNVPTALSISGKGILHKRLEKNQELESTKLLAIAIPNAKASDFYIQSLVGNKNYFLSVARKPTVHEILEKFDKETFNIISVSFGGLVLHCLAPLLEENASYAIQEHLLQFKGGEIAKYEYGNTAPASEITLAEEKIPSTLAVAYASAFQHFIPFQVKSEMPSITESFKEYQNKQLFFKLGWGLLIFFLTVLLANYFIFTTLSTDTDRLRMASILQQSQVEQLGSLKKEVSEKESFLKKAGWMESSRASFYADRIASTIPESVSLISISIKPLNEKLSREERKQLFDEEIIAIIGTCKRPIDLNGWIRQLKDFSWAKKVNIETYSYDTGERAGNFKVEITF